MPLSSSTSCFPGSVRSRSTRRVSTAPAFDRSISPTSRTTNASRSRRGSMEHKGGVTFCLDLLAQDHARPAQAVLHLDRLHELAHDVEAAAPDRARALLLPRPRVA